MQFKVSGNNLICGVTITGAFLVLVSMVAVYKTRQNPRLPTTWLISSNISTNTAQTVDSKLVQQAKNHLAFFYEFEDKEAKIYSQNGEDGVISHLFDNLGTTDKFYVEFGVQTCSECVTRYLWEKKGWDGVLMDGDGKTNDARVIHNHFMTAENIVSLFKKYSVPKVFDFLSVDIDRNDFYVATAIFDAGYRPNFLSLEINRSFNLHQAYTIKYDSIKMWDYSHRFGMSPYAAARLASKYGYSPVYYEREGVNMFFIKRARVVDYLKKKTGFVFSEHQVEDMLPKYEEVYRHHSPIHFSGSTDDFQAVFQQEKPLWNEVGEDGNIIGV